MREANIKLVQDIYAAFGRQDIPALLGMIDPEIVVGIVGRKEDAPMFGMHHGHDGGVHLRAAGRGRLHRTTQEGTRGR